MQEGWRCPQCGQINSPTQTYCEGCKPYYWPTFPQPQPWDWPKVEPWPWTDEPWKVTWY